MRNPFAAVIAIQLGLIFGIGLFIAFTQPLFARVDERAHLSYIETIATQHRLPVLGKDCVPPSLVPLQPGYPGRQPGEACDKDINAASYEAFHPPLYHLLAAPFYSLPLSPRGKITAVRLFTLALLAATLGLIARFLRREMPSRWLPVFALTLTFFLVPGVLMRAATVGNGPMEMLISTAFLIAAWAAATTGRTRPILIAGLLLGLGLLTRTTLVYLAAVFAAAVLAGWMSTRRNRVIAAGAAGGILTGLLVLPWVAFNESHFGTLTADTQARQMQQYVNNPYRHHFAVRDLPERDVMMADIVPDEWETVNHITPAGGLPRTTAKKEVIGGLLILALLVPVALGARRSSTRRYMWFALPTAVGLITLNATTLIAQWELLYPRYLYPVLPGAVAAAGISLLALLPRRRWYLALVCVASIALVALFGVKARHGLARAQVAQVGTLAGAATATEGTVLR